MKVNAIESEASGKRAPQPAQPFERYFLTLVAGYLELPVASDPHFDLIAMLEIQSLHDRRGQTDGEAVPPFGYLHGFSPGYTFLIVYPRFSCNGGAQTSIGFL
jgi:hypothetical protein